MRSKRLIIVN